MGMCARRSHVAIYAAILALVLVLMQRVYGEVEDVSMYSINGSAAIYLEEYSPIIYLYINYSSGPGSLLIELPTEPAEDSIEIVYGNVSSIFYMGYLYALILTNSSNSFVVLRYKGGYGDASAGYKSLKIENVSWASYIDLIARRGTIITGLPPDTEESGENSSVKYRIYRLDGAVSIYILIPRNSLGSKLISLLAGTLTLGAAITYYAIFLHRRRSLVKGDIDAIDREIIKTLKESGGELPVSKIQKLTGLPKTTLWRRLRKLERFGYIEIYRIGRGSVAKLKKIPKF
ncbi:MAG: winged helix-turn-helix transcriptional regulator [Desulfurococcales archaeon]|jgi:uncharacterized membrane protein|nr:winged helix-turn-helix transcriptional regulator [Desulfurococcales archaeon]